MADERILIIDDDPILLELLSDHLKRAGYQPSCVQDGISGLQLFTELLPDLVLLDVMMPNLDGWEICRMLRKKTPVPIIMLTAKGEEIDKLRGFHLGVDDYVTKPFSFAELAARVGAVLGRTSRQSASRHSLTSGDLTIDFDRKEVTVASQPVDLTPTEYRLLEMLAKNANRTFPGETLLLEIWGPEYSGEFEHVKHVIWTLRKKIESDPGDPKHIFTKRGFGYYFN
jgi:two-component system response regulator VicR